LVNFNILEKDKKHSKAFSLTPNYLIGFPFGVYFRQLSPEERNTTREGMALVLNPYALQPRGCAGSQVV
jgi:hypothetical protein